MFDSTASGGKALRCKNRRRSTRLKRLMNSLLASLITWGVGNADAADVSHRASGERAACRKEARITWRCDEQEPRPISVSLWHYRTGALGFLSQPEFTGLRRVAVYDDVDTAALQQLARAATLRELHIGGEHVRHSDLKNLRAGTNLEILHITDGVLTPVGFQEIARMARLNTLVLDNVRFPERGYAMKDLVAATKLRNLWLRSLRLTNAELSCLQHLQSIEELRLDNNVPIDETGCGSIAKLGRLRRLFVRNLAAERSLAPLRNHESLEALWIVGGEITGEGLRELKHAPNLRKLILAFCTLTSSGMEAIAALPHLRDLTIQCSRFKQCDLQPITALQTLEKVRLRGPLDDDPPLDPIIGLPNLKELRFGPWGREKGSLQALSQARLLERLDIHYDAPSEAELTVIASLPRLRALSLTFCELTDRDLELIAAKPPSLESLDVSLSEITDRSLRELQKFRRLEKLRVRSAKRLTDAGVRQIARIVSLRELDLSRNQITNDGVASLLHLPKLRVLKLRYATKLTEAALPQLTNLTSLEELDLTGTNLHHLSSLCPRGPRVHTGAPSVPALKIPTEFLPWWCMPGAEDD